MGGPPPWGYAIEKTGTRGSRLVIAEAEAEVVLNAVRLIVDEKKNVSETARALNTDGHHSRGGLLWTPSNLHRRLRSSALLEGVVVFRNPARKGKNRTRLDEAGVPLHGDSVTIPVPRILSAERAEALKEALRELGHASHASAGHYPLTGRIIGRCGYGYVGTYRKSNGTRYYRCGGGNNGRGKEANCTDPHLTADEVEAAVWNEVMRTVSDPEFAGASRRRPNSYPGDVHKQRERVAAFANSLQEKEAVVARATADLARVRGLEAVKEAALRQLASDVRDAAAQLARGKEVLAEQEKAHRVGAVVSGLAPMAKARRLQSSTPQAMSEVIEYLDITVRPLGVVRKRSGVKCKVTEWHERTGTPAPAEVPESLWPVVEELMAAHFPRRQFSRGAVDVRTQLNGILHRLRTGCLWDELPARYGPWTLAKDRQNTWFKKGFWPVLVRHLNLAGASAPVRREPHVPPLDVMVGAMGRAERETHSSL